MEPTKSSIVKTENLKSELNPFVKLIRLPDQQTTTVNEIKMEFPVKEEIKSENEEEELKPPLTVFLSDWNSQHELEQESSDQETALKSENVILPKMCQLEDEDSKAEVKIKIELQESSDQETAVKSEDEIVPVLKMCQLEDVDSKAEVKIKTELKPFDEDSVVKSEYATPDLKPSHLPIVKTNTEQQDYEDKGSMENKVLLEKAQRVKDELHNEDKIKLEMDCCLMSMSSTDQSSGTCGVTSCRRTPSFALIVAVV